MVQHAQSFGRFCRRCRVLIRGIEHDSKLTSVACELLQVRHIASVYVSIVLLVFLVSSSEP